MQSVNGMTVLIDEEAFDPGPDKQSLWLFCVAGQVMGNHSRVPFWLIIQ